MNVCTDITKNSILLEDINHETTGNFPGIRETDLQIIADHNGKRLHPLKTIYQTPDGEEQHGFVFQAKKDMTVIQTQPYQGQVMITIKKIKRINRPKKENTHWVATLETLQITNNLSEVEKEFLPAVNTGLRKLKKPNSYNSFPAYAVRNKGKKNPDGQPTKLHCLRCGWSWTPRRFDEDGNPILPKTCPNPKCKSPYWNKPRRVPKTEATKE